MLPVGSSEGLSAGLFAHITAEYVFWVAPGAHAAEGTELMSPRLKRTLKALAASGMAWRACAALRKPGVVVLMYHRVVPPGGPFDGLSPKLFREQMLWVKRRCLAIAPEEYADAVSQPSRWRPFVLVTFDDAFRDYYEHAYPVLQDLGIPAVVFAPTAFMGTTRLIWTDAVAWAFHRTARQRIEVPWASGSHWVLGEREAQRRAVSAAKQYLKGIPDRERMAQQLRLFEALGVDPDDGSAGRQMMTWDEVRSTLKLTRYGGHSHTHPILSQISRHQIDAEVRQCRDTIAQETGVVPRYFAYPNGRRQDFSVAVKESLREHGFELAFSTIPGVNDKDTDRYAIRRQPTTAGRIADFAWLVAGRGVTG